MIVETDGLPACTLQQATNVAQSDHMDAVASIRRASTEIDPMAGRTAISWRRYIPVGIAAILLALGGCAPGPHIVTTALREPGAPGGTVCVLSVAGKSFALRKVGITVLGNDNAAVDVSAWGIDGFIAREIASLTNGQIATKAVPVAVGSPAAVRGTSSDTRGVLHDDNSAWEVAKRNATADKSCHLLLTVNPGNSKFSSTNQFVSGIGMVEAPGLIEGRTYVYALIALYLYDARTMQRITWANRSSKHSSLVDMITGPHRQVDSSWRMSPLAISASLKHKEAVEALVREGLADLVPKVLSFERREQATRPSAGNTRRQLGTDKNGR
jgi:hypothetical protein